MPETAVKKHSEQELKAPVRTSVEFALKDSKLEEGEFQGLASVFNHEVDAFIPTIVEPGAFKKTLKERGDRIKVLWQHDRSEPIGFPIELKETDEGLSIHGKISDTARGRDALALMRDGNQLGKSLELSIGFEPIRWSMEKRKGSKDEEVRRLQEVRLNEISFVTLAADDKAQVTEVRKEEDSSHEEESEPKKNTLGEFISPVLDEVADLELELAGDADDEVTPPRLADADSDEDFAGRILSDTNRKRLAQVVTILKQLLDAAAPPDSTDPDTAKCKDKKKKKGQETKALEHVNEQWMDAELARARAQLKRLNGG